MFFVAFMGDTFIIIVCVYEKERESKPKGDDKRMHLAWVSLLPLGQSTPYYWNYLYKPCTPNPPKKPLRCAYIHIFWNFYPCPHEFVTWTNPSTLKKILKTPINVTNTSSLNRCPCPPPFLLPLSLSPIHVCFSLLFWKLASGNKHGLNIILYFSFLIPLCHPFINIEVCLSYIHRFTIVNLKI